MYQKVAYAGMPAHLVGRLLGQLNSGIITIKHVKVTLACMELIERRKVAAILRKEKGKRAFISCYSLKEISELTGLGPRVVSRLLKDLSNEKLLSFEPTKIHIIKTEDLSHFSLELLKRGGLRRLIPLPRRFIKELCQEKRRSIFLTKLAYGIRGLSLTKDKELKSTGSVKASWISNYFGLSLRAVKLARKELILAGFITKDTGSFQYKLNRSGAYFRIDLCRYAGTRASSVPAQKNLPESEIAPPRTSNSRVFTPPYIKQVTSKEYKNQKTLGEPKSRSGVFTKQKLGKGDNPSIKNVVLEDLHSFSRIEKLYFQACKAGLIQNSEPSALNFLSAACRARGLGKVGDPVKIFMGIVRRKLWRHITQADEDRALCALRKYRAEDPSRFRIAA